MTTPATMDDDELDSSFEKACAALSRTCFENGVQTPRPEDGDALWAWVEVLAEERRTRRKDKALVAEIMEM